jgi:hypothetical protein
VQNENSYIYLESRPATRLKNKKNSKTTFAKFFEMILDLDESKSFGCWADLQSKPKRIV